MSLQRIDIHHHIFPPEYLAAIDRLGLTEAGGGGVAFPDWSLSASLEMMDRHDIQTAIASIASPGVYFGDARLARELARRCNEYSASVVREYPDRFGFFASVPLPAISDAIAEAAYALDTLKCDGLALMGSVADRFLGDPEFEESMQELDRRKTVVLIHPHVHSSNRQLGLKFPAALFEFLADTTRAVLNLALSGTLHRYPNIRWILVARRWRYSQSRVAMGPGRSLTNREEKRTTRRVDVPSAALFRYGVVSLALCDAT